MSDRTRIGPAVDSKLWERFRQDIKARKGAVRGNLGEELDRALREYLKDGPTEQEEEIIERLDRIETAIGATPADGGTDLSERSTHTRADADPVPEADHSPPAEKPSANAASEKKVRWLAEQLIQQEVPNTRELESVSKRVLRELVVDAYGFRSDTAKRYVEMLQDHFGLRPHPNTEKVLVTDEKAEELIRSDVGASE